jgi:hypothetical protein
VQPHVNIEKIAGVISRVLPGVRRWICSAPGVSVSGGFTVDNRPIMESISDIIRVK